MYKSSQLGEFGTGILTRCWWEDNMVQTFWKTIWQFLKEQSQPQQKALLVSNPVIPLLAIHLREMRAFIHTMIFT